MSERGVCICPECGCQFSDDQKAKYERTAPDYRPLLEELVVALDSYTAARMADLRGARVPDRSAAHGRLMRAAREARLALGNGASVDREGAA